LITTVEIDIFDIAFSIAVALIFARGMGYVFDKFKQPAVIGEILAGVILGSMGLMFFSGQNIAFLGMHFDMPSLDFTSAGFTLFAELGILFLLFISGLETSLSKLKKMGKNSALVAAGGVLLPLFLGCAAGLYFGFGPEESLVIGLILIATSVGVTVRTLLDLHVLNTDVGTTILGGAVIDDVLGVILLAFVLGIESPLWVGLKIIIFFLIFLYLGLKVIDKILDLGEKILLPKALLSITLTIFLLYSFFADRAGIAGIIGAFVAGLVIGHTIRSHKIVDDVKAIGYGFFVPLFFVWIGASLNLSIFTTIGLLAFVIISLSIIGKIVGCGLGAKLAGMTNRESLQVGVGMVPRMEMALIIVSAAIARQVIVGESADKILAITILLTVVTTLVAPFLIKSVFKSR